MKYCVATTNIVGPQNDDEDLIVVFHILCDGDGKPAPQGHSFGWRGIPNRAEANVYPFILRANGQIDFGAAVDSMNSRFGTTSILELDRLQVGVTFEFNEDDDRDIYEVRAVIFPMER